MPKKRSAPVRIRVGPPVRDPQELSGFLVSVEHRLSTRRLAGEPERELEREAGEARRAVESENWSDAEARLRAVDQRLRETQLESELREFPRGLVGYEARGARGVPVSDDEDPLANRLRLTSRLLDLRRAQGAETAEPLVQLREAEAAFRAGDRGTARRKCDAVITSLERLSREGAQD